MSDRQSRQRMERLKAAAAAAKAAPGDGAAWAAFGETLLELHDMNAAAAALQRAVQLTPTPLNFANLGSALAGADRLDESLAALQKAVELAPDWSEAHRGVGAALYTAGRVDEAMVAFRRALDLDPANAAAHSMLLYMLLFQGTMPPAQVRQEHVAWARRHTAHVPPLPPPANDRQADRRLRVGYVSPNFRSQAVAIFMLPIFEHHDPWEVEIFAYSDAPAGDLITARFRQRADEWRESASLSDSELAERVRQDGIDILVDLTGHIGGGRLRSFAAKPAPIQVAYLGYQATTGLAEMDYVISDVWADPPGETEPFWVERVWRLDRPFYCYGVPAQPPQVNELPATAKGYVTFGCLNNLAKVTPRTLDAWAAVLAAVPHSRLHVLTPNAASVHERLRQQLGARGVAGERLQFVHRAPLAQYLAEYGRIDLALDPLPFGGHTTTCDAAWMGVPTISLAGGCYAHRYGSSVMRECGLPELVALDEASYIRTAINWSQDLPRLAQVRGSLRQHMQNASITDADAMVRSLERAYRQMWQRWCGG